MELHSDLNNEHLTETIRGLMEENYDLGAVKKIKNIFGGYCNKSYAVWMSANDHTHRYFLRLYQPKAIESEILFEHALLNHLRSNGFTLAAAIVPCRNGATLVHTPAPENHRGNIALWALFEFLEGEDKYSWTDTNLTAVLRMRSPGFITARMDSKNHPKRIGPNPRSWHSFPLSRRPFPLFWNRQVIGDATGCLKTTLNRSAGL